MQEPRHICQTSHHDWGQMTKCSQDCGERWWDPWAAPIPTPLHSLDHGFKSDGTLVSTSSSVSSRSDRSGGSRNQLCGQCCQQPRWHMKINLPGFKDEDKKDTITYWHWHWGIMMYCQAGCQDCTLLLYNIHSLQGYPKELVRSSGTGITLDDVLTVLDECYNNVKALDAMNQDLFQLWMAKKETMSDWGCTFWGTSKSSQPHSQNDSHQTTLLNWSMTTSMVGYLNS